MRSDSVHFRATALLIIALGVLFAQVQIAMGVPKSRASKAAPRAASASNGKALGHLKNGRALALATAVTVPVGTPNTTLPTVSQGSGPSQASALGRVTAKEKKDRQNSSGLGAAAEPGTITIKKDAVPDGDGSFHFTGDLGPFDLKDEVGLSFSDLRPGIYDVTEAKAAGWKVDHIVCGDPTAGASIVDQGRTVSINLPPGGDTTCTFVNRKSATDPKDGDDAKGDKERDTLGKGDKKGGPGVKPLPLTGGPVPDWFLFSAGMFLISGGLLLRMERRELYL